MEIINKILWIIATSLILINSIYFSIKLKLPQLRITKLIKSIKTKSTKEEITPKDTLIMTLSSKIGVGSLSGTALCIYYGGLGAIFWIFLSSFLLSIITYIENILSIIYKEKDDNHQKSGPSYYIKKGLNNKPLSIIYAIIMLITYGVLFSAIQNNTITTLTINIFNISKVTISFFITLISGIAITKGIKTISNICNKIFPIMMLFLITIGIIIILLNINYIPTIILSSVKQAFNRQSITSGVIYTLLIALQKTIFANESGVGTSAVLSGITDSSDCKLQSNIGILQTYFINFIVLGITSLIIATALPSNVSISNGIELTKYAFHYHLGYFGDLSLLLMLILFSYSSIITIYYYGENSLKFLTKNKISIRILKIITILSIFIGGIIKSSIIWLLIDISLAVLTIINMYAIYKLKEVVISANK